MEQCEERQRLANAYALAIKTLSLATHELQHSPNDELVAVLEEIKQARIECGRARRAVDEHTKKHFC